MNPDFSDDIPKTDWSNVSACCDGGRCTAPVEKPFSEQLQERADKIREQEATSIATFRDGNSRPLKDYADELRRRVSEKQPTFSDTEPTIEHCEAVAARLIAAQTEWNSLRKKPHDPVKQPAHYTFGAVEPIVAIHDWQLSYNLGCVVKYVVRAKHKGNELLDLEKAAEYLRREIEFCRARSSGG